MYCRLAALAAPVEEDEMPEIDPDMEFRDVEMLPMAEETESETDVRNVQLENRQNIAKAKTRMRVDFMAQSNIAQAQFNQKKCPWPLAALSLIHI